MLRAEDTASVCRLPFCFFSSSILKPSRSFLEEKKRNHAASSPISFFFCMLKAALLFFSLLSLSSTPAMACSGAGPCAVGHVWAGEPTGKNER